VISPVDTYFQQLSTLPSGLRKADLLLALPNRRSLGSAQHTHLVRDRRGSADPGPAENDHQTKGTGFDVQVLVRDNNVDQALRALKKKMQREGIFREMKMRDYYEKPSQKRAREKAEAVRRVRKLARKKMQREGLIAAPARPAFSR